MCIEVSRARFYVTKKPKTCYKVLFEHNKKLYPPYYCEKMSYKLNLKYSISESEFKETIKDSIFSYNSYKMTTVGFYSFNNIESARRLKKKLTTNLFFRNRYSNFVIVECEIPENTKYLSGKERGCIFLGKSYQTYCSQSIIIRKIIK